MIVQDFYLKRWDWDVRVYYYVDDYYADDILDDLEAIGCYDTDIIDILFSKPYNTGLTYTSPYYNSALIVISETTSPEEFQSTFDHEKGHLAVHIADSLGIDLRSEEFQYLVGEIGKKMYPIAKLFLCEHCSVDLINYKGLKVNERF